MRANWQDFYMGNFSALNGRVASNLNCAYYMYENYYILKNPILTPTYNRIYYAHYTNILLSPVLIWDFPL